MSLLLSELLVKTFENKIAKTGTKFACKMSTYLFVPLVRNNNPGKRDYCTGVSQSWTVTRGT